uniref:Uncharacterized protein n=1 Tax=Arundo donax TaxID=35708 RepID=A0A0A9HH74_ARUDO
MDTTYASLLTDRQEQGRPLPWKGLKGIGG